MRCKLGLNVCSLLHESDLVVEFAHAGDHGRFAAGVELRAACAPEDLLHVQDAQVHIFAVNLQIRAFDDYMVCW